MANKIRLGENAFVADRGEFLAVDAKDQEKAIGKSGMADGGKNSPRAGASQFSATEQDIIQKTSQTAQQTWNALQQYFGSFNTRLVKIVDTWEPQALINTIGDVRAYAESQLSGKISEFKHASNIVLPQWRNADSDYENFRKEHNLTRNAHYDAGSKMIGLFACIVIAEAVLNATLLWELTGILTAFGQTALITLVNVLFSAALVGLLFRYKNHKSLSRRCLAWMCLPVVAFVLVFNIGVGHYRDALVEAKNQGEQIGSLDWDNLDADIGVVVDYTKQAMISMKDSLFGVESVLSALLIIVGLGFFGFATYKWYSMFDPCPGYKKCDIARNEAHVLYNKLVSDTRADIDKCEEGAGRKTTDERTKIMNNRTNHEDLVTRAHNLQEQYARWVEVLGQTQNHLLTVYRQSNEQARSEPAPDYFNQNREIDDKFVTPPIFNPPELKNDQKVVDAVQDATNKINIIVKEVRRKFESIVSEASGK